MKRYVFISIILVTIINGCRKDESDSRIDSDIIIRINETLDSNERVLVFNCYTEKQYPCCNYQIDYSLNTSANEIDIEFNKIITYELCLTATGPACATIQLGHLSEGTYILDFKAGNKKCTGNLVVTPYMYSVILNNQKHIKLNNKILNRVPDNLIWGEIGYSSDINSSVAQTFIDSLIFYGATPVNLPQGNYYYFQINSSGQIVSTDDNVTYIHRKFIYNYSSNSSALRSLVQRYGTTMGDTLLIDLNTSKGESFLSWVN